MISRERSALLALAAAVAAFPVLLAIGAGWEALGYLSPLLSLLALLLRGRYVGEDALCRAASGPRLRRAPRSRTATPRPIRVSLARGGALIATSLAVRPPPALVRI